jgi:hypothetical protein
MSRTSKHRMNTDDFDDAKEKRGEINSPRSITFKLFDFEACLSKNLETNSVPN